MHVNPVCGPGGGFGFGGGCSGLWVGWGRVEDWSNGSDRVVSGMLARL